MGLSQVPHWTLVGWFSVDSQRMFIGILVDFRWTMFGRFRICLHRIFMRFSLGFSLHFLCGPAAGRGYIGILKGWKVSGFVSVSTLLKVGGLGGFRTATAPRPSARLWTTCRLNELVEVSHRLRFFWSSLLPCTKVCIHVQSRSFCGRNAERKCFGGNGIVRGAPPLALPKVRPLKSGS